MLARVLQQVEETRHRPGMAHHRQRRLCGRHVLLLTPHDLTSLWVPPLAVGLLPPGLLRLEVRLRDKQLVSPCNDHLFGQHQLLVRGVHGQPARRGGEDGPQVHAVDGGVRVLSVEVAEGVCGVGGEGGHGRVVLGRDPGEIAERGVPVGQMHRHIVPCPSHILWQKPSRHKRSCPHAALPVGVLFAAERVVVAIDGAAIVARVHQHRVLPHTLGLEQRHELPHKHIGTPQHAAVDVAGGVSRGFVVRCVDRLVAEVDVERAGGRVVLGDSLERQLTPQVGGVLVGTRRAGGRLGNPTRHALLLLGT
mmetsp:Transcript_22326/g.52890  ORF Transcript_22326/g.52890 Transcript_22326/m.52890 type:complete len:307 (+) Transcript_22326:292-1212(+)